MRRANVIAQALTTFFENKMDVRATAITTMNHALENSPSVFDGPVVMVADRIAGGLDIAVFVDEGDNLEAINADIYKALQGKCFELGDANLLPTFSKSRPIFDDSDFHIGECLTFLVVEHSFSLAA